MKKKRARKPKPVVPLQELAARLNLTVPEAQRLSGFGRTQIVKLCESGQWEWYWEGKNRRIITQSIVEYQHRRSKENLPRAS